ncbi:MAG: UbiX family flavin prenyltransferase [Pirellulaceae bacterium]|nr:UbiX family flavin prenyltransferase [Pirellulaceae bacterium]
MSHPIVVAFTGGSGPGYGRRLVEVLLELQQPVHLTISPAATQVIEHELDVSIDLKNFSPELFWPGQQSRFANLHYYHYQDFMTPMASGSFLTRGMVICPCSGATLSATANGNSRNLIERAAEVHLKESRKLILVQRETPLSLPTIENMRKAKLAGAVILPAMPAWYHGDQSVAGLIVVAQGLRVAHVHTL